jgi:hypothetical protein
MTTRKEIIAQIDDELVRLERVRDLLIAALKDARNGSSLVLSRKLKVKVTEKKRKQPAKIVSAVTTKVKARVVVAPQPPAVKEEPEIKRLPPRRRVERRQAPSEKLGKSAVALSGSVPAGPVVVSANEARKIQERGVQAVPPQAVAEVRAENPGERTLGSLIQAFERRSGLNGLETT